MKTAEEILKNSYEKNVKPLLTNMPDFNKAKGESGYDWIFEAMHEFAIEAIKADREDAAEKAKSTIKCSETDYCPCYGSSDCYAKYASIDKSSITDRPLPTFKQ